MYIKHSFQKRNGRLQQNEELVNKPALHTFSLDKERTLDCLIHRVASHETIISDGFKVLGEKVIAILLNPWSVPIKTVVSLASLTYFSDCFQKLYVNCFLVIRNLLGIIRNLPNKSCCCC